MASKRKFVPSAADTAQMAAGQWAAMKEQLLAMCPDLAEDEEALLDTLEGETNFHEVMAGLARAALYREHQAKAMGELIARYSERRTRHKKVGENIRAVLLKTLLQAGVKNIKHADATLSVSDLADKVELLPDTDIEMVPDAYIKTETVKSIDMQKVTEAINNGVDLDFIVIHNDRHSISIRV